MTRTNFLVLPFVLILLLFGMTIAYGESGETKTINGLTGPAHPKGFSVKTLAEIDLGKEYPDIPETAPLRFRARYVTLEPGGKVLIHSHKHRPATTYILEGEAVEYRSDAAGPILRKAGEATMDVNGIAQWWENVSDAPVLMFVGDVISVDAAADH